MLQRTITVVALAAYLLATIGVPLPHRFVKFDGVPFPCQDHACGCHTAAQCWEQCCCYTAAQKLAWCHEHNVEPPAQLPAALAAADSYAPGALPAKWPRSCCAGQVAASHCGSHDAHRQCGLAGCAVHDNADERVGGIVMVIGPLMRQCRGMVDLWCLSGAVGPPPAPIQWHYEWRVVGRVAALAVFLDPSELAPPVPPPRLVSA